MTIVNKQDSNTTGLRYCEEASLATLPALASQIWYPAEPNSYSDFGGQIKTVARNPINSSRQNRKGVTVDLDASGGWNSDLTQNNALRFLQGFMFADFREPYDTGSLNDASDLSAVSGVFTANDTYRMNYSDSMADVLANMLLFASGFSVSANNGVKTVASATAAAATAVLTSSLNYADTETVVINGKTYTFQDILTNTDGHVKVGASEAASMLNLHHAINGTGGVSGVDYAAATTAHPDVTATDDAAHAVTITAKKKGRAGNAITTTETCTNASWGGVVMSGGQADIATVENLTDETPTSAARVQVVGYEFATGTLDVNMSNSLPRLVRATGAVDFTTLGLIPGQPIFVGGDSSGLKFVNAANNGWARVHSIAATYIELDKTTSTMAAETGTGLTVQLFFGKVLKNEADPTLIKRRSFQLERDLGQKDTSIAAHQGEYLVGSVPNELTMTVKQADKVNMDLTFVATDNTHLKQSDGGLKSALAAGGGGSAPALVSEDAFNTSSHVARLRMSIPTTTDANPTPLFAFLTEFTVVVNNNVTPNKAVSVLGAFDLTAGQFDVSGKVTAYFSDVAAIAAVRDNSDVSLDFALARDNAGVFIDMPLISLGDGRLNVEQNNPITLPLDMNAAAHTIFNHTLLVGVFAYLPNAAM